MKHKLRVIFSGVAGLILGAGLLAGVGAYAFTINNGVLTMQSGESLTAVCSSGLHIGPSFWGVANQLTCGSATTTTTSSSTTTTSSSTTTTTTSQPQGGNCTNPIFTTSDAQGTIRIDDPGFWWVDNDAWNGSHGPQTLSVCNQSSWFAVSQQANNQGQVETYPNTEYDVCGRNNSCYPSTKPLSAYSSITSTFSEAFPTTGDSIDAAYDLWTNNWGGPGGHEIMIWNEVTGTQTYWSNCVKANNCGHPVTSFTVGGVAYHAVNLGGELIAIRDVQVKSGTADLKGVMNAFVTAGWMSSSEAPTQLEYGVEICSTTGAQTFPLTGLTFNLS
jgi:hypothetical protein